MNEEFDILKKNMEHYAILANKHKTTLTKFLSEVECELLEKLIKRPAKYTLFGGYEDAEMKRALIHHEEDEVSIEDFEILLLEIESNPKFLVLTHKNIFGTLMNLGIKRNTFGDIVVNEKAYLFIDQSMLVYFLNELHIVGGVSVSVKVVSINDHQNILKKEYVMDKIIVSSMRLDVIVARVSNFSREKSQTYIKAQLVKLNHKTNENPSQIVKINDIISIRKIGRVKIFGEIGQTKKDKIVLSIGMLR